ncbi:flagellar hook-length control protein FliK [Nitrosovibrio tenuis]|uniref:Hook-length control protein FliK n=1 Tax=Nitrosovibrio tenuis TaxID=1233 RepID=A0A1H7J6L2_9PROT|nr:flagellar hook-length control protein FliK [Nitrosovibrio tenuis]SEK69507.1 hook-length control protein FliK [Nitrosovibrio tenuis]
MPRFDALHPVAAIDPGAAIAQRHSGDSPFLRKLELGQRLQATVQASLSNGEFAVMLHSQDGGSPDGQAWRMQLPVGVRPGDILKLIFIGHEARSEFVLAEDASPRPQSPLLSGTGRFIDDLLRHPVFPDSPAALSKATPLLEVPPGSGAELSLRLAQALERSGLFYESHQAQWVGGVRPFSELLAEPQAHLAWPGLPGKDKDANEANVRATIMATTDPAVEDTSLISDRLSLNPAHPNPSDRNPVHFDALALVRQQLEVFETRHIAWQGEAWPGQALSLEICEEERRESGEPDQPSAIPWNACLCLTLPNLGQVTVGLRLHRHGLEVNLETPDHAVIPLLRSGALSLTHGLEGAGIRLLGMGVKVNDEQV